VLHILAVDQTDLNQRVLLVEKVLPWITNVAGGSSGARWGQTVPSWGRATPAYGPSAPYHVHLVQMFMFVTILAYFCHISYIQIILQVQVELGEI
jgi:hypothetical protein